MGRKLSRLLESAPDFLTTGVIAAILKEDRTMLELRKVWIIRVIRGEREGRQAFTRWVGMGSGKRGRIRFINKMGKF